MEIWPITFSSMLPILWEVREFGSVRLEASKVRLRFGWVFTTARSVRWSRLTGIESSGFEVSISLGYGPHRENMIQ